MVTTRPRPAVSKTFETWGWLFMRLSGVALIPLVWIHVLLQDVLVGVHRINLDYVALRWAMTGWRVYDFLLLSFAFGHGMNGLRAVLTDYLPGHKRAIDWLTLLFWIILSLIGAVAIIGGVRKS